MVPRLTIANATDAALIEIALRKAADGATDGAHFDLADRLRELARLAAAEILVASQEA